LAAKFLRAAINADNRSLQGEFVGVFCGSSD
jgi:hypothetical protein